MKKVQTSLICLICFIIYSCQSSNLKPPQPLNPVPDKYQIEWQEKELFAFIHYTVNAFTDKEWGYGDEDPDIFNHVDYNPDQWAGVLEKAGFKGVILTAKHHDGFCLWPSAFTEHSVKSSKWMNGKGDVVGGLKNACDRYGLEFGIYLSPWDRNHAGYASPEYVEYYKNQLQELLEKYGPVFEIWFDGANGGDGYYGGANEKRKIDDQVYYQWPETYKTVRDFNPETIIRGDARSACDSRWCGNEKGFVGETNWNMILQDSLIALGKSRKRVDILNNGNENGTIWMPAEVDVSIRPGWFYHASQDSLVKTPDELFEIYLKSIGRGSPLLLNIPPDSRGLIHDTDVHALLQWKKRIDDTFSKNIAPEAKIIADSYRGKSRKYDPVNLIDGDKNTYWATNDDIYFGSIEFDFNKQEEVQYIVLQEYITLGQRVKSFTIEVFLDGKWEKAAEATTIGYKRIVRIDPVETGKIKINITEAKACPLISNIEIY